MTLEIDPKFLRLLQEVRDASERNELRWEATLLDDSYRVSKPYGSVWISKEIPSYPQGGFVYAAMLTDETGRSIEIARAVEAPRGAGVPDTPHVSLLKSLFEAAERSARRPTDVLDRMLAEFSGKGR